MIELHVPQNNTTEAERLSALANLGIMDSPAETNFDELTRLAAATAGTRSAAISLVDNRRQWFKARHNIPVPETPRDQSFCAHALEKQQMLVVPDASLDPRFMDNPLVTGPDGIRFYAGFPLVLASGHCIGALCVFDPAARSGLTQSENDLLADLAKIATTLIETRRYRHMGEIASRVIDTTSDAVMCVNNAGEITFWSRAAEKMFGQTAAEAIGQQIDFILPRSMAAKHHAGFRRAVAGGPTNLVGGTVELMAVRADGSEFAIELSLSRWGDNASNTGFAAIIRDVSERKVLERERQHAREFLDVVVKNLPAMLFVKDTATREYLLVNRAGEEMIGRSAQDLLGRSDRDLFPQSGATYELRDTETLKANGPTTFESTFTRDDGTTVQLRTKRIVIDGPERPRQYILGLSEDTTEVRKAEAEVLRLAHFDALTGLLNRASFVERLHRLVTSGAPIALLSIDLDRFKAVNDQFGHPLGDEVLAQVGERLLALKGAGDLVARTGGDEFALIVVGEEARSRSEQLAAAIVKKLAEPYVTFRGTAYMGASVGIAMSPDDATNMQELRQCVDLALYRAKGDGRGRVCSYNAQMDAEARDRQLLEGDLRRAIAAGDMALLYQPLFSAQTGQVTSVEALARWHHPTRGPIRPDVFISVAEESGLIEELGDRLLLQACSDACSWPDHIKVAVNLSPLQFQTDGLCERVSRVLEATGLPAKRLQLEVTEGLVIRDVERTFVELERLRALGIQILMDDFGVGYSSLSYFERFRFDKVKIDKSFVDRLSSSQASKAVIRAVVGLGQELGMAIVAEGVETEDQMRLLVELGCTHLQGFLFSEPLRADLIGTFSRAMGVTMPHDVAL